MAEYPGRIWEIDFFRGFAIVSMILFHSAYDLSYLGRLSVDFSTGFWFLLPRATASLFILLAGVSLVLSYNRQVSSGNKRLYPKYLKRGFLIFSPGMLVTLTTLLFAEENFIVFGILHCIGLSIILAYPLIRFRTASLLLGISCISLGAILQGMVFDFPYLLWLGFVPRDFHTLDYFPLLPWFGVTLVGVFLGNALYAGFRSRLHLPAVSQSHAARLLCMLGRNSLFIYLLHQPVILALISLSAMPG